MTEPEEKPEYPIQFDPESIGEPHARLIYAYWRGKAAGRDVPARRDIDPAEILSLLPHVFLYEVHQADPPGYTVRIMGETMQQSVQGIRRGMSLEALHGAANWARVRQTYDRTVSLRRPDYVEHALHFQGIHYVTLRRILLPLAEPDGRISRLIGTAVFTTIRKHAPNRFSELVPGS
jgi:hypothetical protein